SLNIDEKLSNLLVQRGVTNFDEAKSFFRPELSHLHDPFLMKDMDIAINRIMQAIGNNEGILVYGDYDVDGTTAVALVFTFLKELHSNIEYYVPDRYSEGYGISLQSIDYAAENNYTLVIALDCGIKAIDKIYYANSKNIDFIICDHHRPGEKVPEAYAILDPKQVDCNYPCKELSGCGVGFKLVQAYAQKNNIPFEKIHKYLDLVVVSIASDIVNITGENRVLAYYGLKLLNTNPRPGFESILKYSGITKEKGNPDNDYVFNRELTITDLVFLIGPRVNAAGRIESARDSVEILISDNHEYAEKLGKLINLLNTERKNLDSQTTEHALEIIGDDDVLINRKSTTVYNPGWHKGVIGIVASRLTEIYYRPTIVFTKSNGFITGSARSVKDFDVYDAIEACSEYLEHFGGHKYAAGLSIKPENLESFCSKFEKVVSETISDEMLIPEVEIDLEIELSRITPKFFKILKQFAPFGPGNMAPVFRTDCLFDSGYARIVGKNHLKLSVADPGTCSPPMPAIAFQQAHHLESILRKKPMNICYHIEENEWNGKVSLQINIKDIKISSD
ncbi:MAG: single-stranded-DNA-specific exonuclease RecJ, partial [Saprospiraceae bacterium]|nr:single-stranded-DNA-specific exonuclease RecJ [Saprospiraceae bacterium]